MRPRSLSTRLLASVSILLIVFFGITIVALDFVFRRRDASGDARSPRSADARAAFPRRRKTRSGGLQPQQESRGAASTNPGSGLYGEILRSDGYPSWRSNSLTGTGLELRRAAARRASGTTAAASRRRLAGARVES